MRRISSSTGRTDLSSLLSPAAHRVGCLRLLHTTTVFLLRGQTLGDDEPTTPLSNYGAPGRRLTQRRRHLSTSRQQDRFRFPQRPGDSHLMRGVSGDGRTFVAQAEEEYRESLQALRSPPGGNVLEGAPTVVESLPDGSTVIKKRLAAPFMETFVPSSKERFAHRGHAAELSIPREEQWMLPENREASSRSLLMERKLNELLEAPTPPEAKAEAAVSFLGSFMEQQLMLQPSTWECVFALWAYAQSVPAQQLTDGSDSPPLPLDGGSQPSSADAASTTKDTRIIDTEEVRNVRYLQQMKSCYLYMRSCFTAPTPSIVEHLMTSLALSGRSDDATYQLANRLLLDADKFVFLPTRTTYAAFFDVCSVCRKMDVAMARFADALDHLHIEPDTGMATSLLRGMNANGLVEEAVALLGRIAQVEVDVPLLNASMEALILSTDPRAVFASYRSVEGAGLLPTSETMTLLLLACEKTADWTPTLSILKDMQRFRVRGDAQCLNLLLKGLLTGKWTSYAEQLYVTMKWKGVPVWKNLESAMSKEAVAVTSLPLSRRQKKKLLQAQKNGTHWKPSPSTEAHSASGGSGGIKFTKQLLSDAQALLHGQRDTSIINKSNNNTARSQKKRANA